MIYDHQFLSDNSGNIIKINSTSQDKSHDNSSVFQLDFFHTGVINHYFCTEKFKYLGNWIFLEDINIAGYSGLLGGKIQMDERLIMGDKPIVEYRKHRQELIDRIEKS
jgi:hypothetical protein